MAEAGMNLDILKKKIGPLPGAAWLGIFAVGGYYVYRVRAKSSAAAPVAAATTTTADASGMGGYQPAGAGAGNGGSSSTSTNTGFADNNAWGSAVINYLVGLGYDASAVNQAVSLYLGSQPLTTQQQAWVNLGIQHFSAPPQLVNAVNGSVGTVGGGGSGTPPGSPVIFGAGPAGAEAKTTTTLANETIRQFVSRVYAADPRVNPTTGDPSRIAHTAEAVFMIPQNALFLVPGVDTPQKAGIPVTYY